MNAFRSSLRAALLGATVVSAFAVACGSDSSTGANGNGGASGSDSGPSGTGGASSGGAGTGGSPATGGNGGGGGTGGVSSGGTGAGGTDGGSEHDSGGGDAHADAGPPAGVYVDPVNGLDTNDGSSAHPFKTVRKASQTVTAGKTVYLLGGTYDSTNQPSMTITFPKDTSLRAVKPGTVTFQYAAGGLTFDGGSIHDVAFEDFGYAISVAGGTFSTAGVSFSNVGCPVSTPAGSDATVTIDMTGVATPVSNVPNGIGCVFVFTDGTSHVTWKGGGVVDRTWTTVPLGAAIFTRGGSTVTVDGVTIRHFPQSAAVIDDNAHLTLKNVTIDDSASGSAVYAILMGGENTQVPMTTSLALDTTSVTASHGHAVSLTLYGGSAETPSLSFVNSHVDGTVGGDGLHVEGTPTNPALTVTISATNTTFTGNSGYGIVSPRATMTLTGGDVSNNGSGGLALTDAASKNSLSIRSTTFGGNGGDFVSLKGAASSSLDLGTKAKPGGVTFTTVPASHSAVNLAAAITGYAVGDTWMPNQQNASSTGAYTAPRTFAAGTSGLNATVGTGASLVVAQ